MLTTSYRRYALAIMTSVYTLNLSDRALITLLLQPIKEDLRLSDTQLGLLTGIAFGLFYATAGLPIARWADRGNRVSIAALAIGLWGLTVMACLWVGNFFQLLLARVAAAVGEAGCKPPTYSLVGDYFPDPVERTRAMSVYWLGSPLAALVTFIVGGRLNELFGWRIAFFLIGIPGLILAVVVRLTLKEPRTQMQNVRTHEQALPSMRAVLGTLWRQHSSRHLCLALLLLYTMSFGLAPWYAAFLIRSHGIATGELGLWLGLIFGLCGVAGILLGGYAASRLFARNERGQMRLTAVSIVLLVPAFVVFLLVPGKESALAALIPLALVFNLFFAPTYALLQRLVNDEMRATTLAVVMLLANLIGMGVGPQIVGVLSDWLRARVGDDSLRYAMLTMSLVAGWSGWHFWRVGRTVSADLAAIEDGVSR